MNTHNTGVIEILDEKWNVTEFMGVCDNCDWKSNVYPNRNLAQNAATNHKEIHQRKVNA